MIAPVAVGELAIRRWVAELAVSANGMHEIREGAVNERNRPLVGYATTYEQAQAIADAHNNSAAVADLIEASSSMLAAALMLAHGTTHGMPGQNPEGARRHWKHAHERLEAGLARVGGAS